MKQTIFSGLQFRVGVLIIVVEILALSLLGWYYSHRFSEEIKRNIHAHIRMPGTLMNRQLLRYESVADQA